MEGLARWAEPCGDTLRFIFHRYMPPVPHCNTWAIGSSDCLFGPFRLTACSPKAYGNQPTAGDLSSLEPDAFAAVCEHLQQWDIAATAASCSALRHAVLSNDRLWSR